jgi:hypothetical protein
VREVKESQGADPNLEQVAWVGVVGQGHFTYTCKSF